MIHSRKYGVVKDAADRKDYFFIAPWGVQIAPMSDLRPICPPVEDQGSLGSCTGNAYATMMEMHDIREGRTHVDLSRLFIYWNERSLIGEQYSDSGARMRDGIKALRKWGVCREELWPYVIDMFDDEPLPMCYADATKRTIQAYYRSYTVRDMRWALTQNLPVAMGFTVYESFESDEVYRTGIVPMPEPGERELGGHAVVVVGHSDADKRFIVRNSWGNQWGMKGYFTMPYQFMTDGIASDCWVIKT